MHKENPYLTDEMARHLTLYGSNWNPDGTLSWKFDNFVRTLSPYAYDIEFAKEVWSQIRCPVLLFYGEDSWLGDQLKDGHIGFIPNHRVIVAANAGHWLHHDQSELFIRETRRFFAASD
jgi:pimeloyl-ACP methyl ester carboxylesterase